MQKRHKKKNIEGNVETELKMRKFKDNKTSF